MATPAISIQSPSASPRRILLLITDLEIGGTPTIVYQLATRLASACGDGAVIEVACLAGWGPVAGRLRDAGITVTAFNARGPHDLRVLASLCRLIDGHQIDTVLSFLIHANAMAALAGLATGVRSFQSIQNTQPDPAWHWAVQRLIHPQAEKIVVPSQSVADATQAWSHVPPGKILVIPNAIDLADYTNVAPIEDGMPLPVGFIGRLDPVKRLPDLIDAVGLLGKRVHLHVFGQGPQQGALELQSASLGLQSQVTFHGTVPTPQEALRQIGLLVLPSEAEGFGLVLIEAMAAGVPVIATNVPGIRDVVIHNRTGLLVEPYSPPALAAAIGKLADDRSLRHCLVAQARSHVSAHFTWQQVLPQYQRFLGLD